MNRAEAAAKYTNQELPLRFRSRITPDELKFFRLAIHPTKRGDSREVTRRLLDYLKDKDLVTSLEIQEALGIAEMTVLKRLSILRQFNFIQRKLHRYYIVTPRLQELVRLYMDRLCE